MAPEPLRTTVNSPAAPAAAGAAVAPVETIDVEAVNSKEQRPLYKSRQKIFPKRATGDFRRLKWIIMVVTLSIYYLTPWIRWDRGPGMPDQAVLVDLANGRFYFFFIEIWPQEVYYITGLLILASFGLFLVTSLFGRAWCGYACPQTVWTDLFIALERFFEGDRSARIRLDKSPWSTSKLAKRVAKHASWLVVSVLTGGAWVFYFADAPALAVDLATGQAAMVAYASIAVLTFTTYSLGGLMREQVCTYMCPWPRIQAAMIDEESLLVSYKEDRGEPRGPVRRDTDWSTRGDCIDCKQCIAVCPAGIDIRDGQQLECISCALCIDACNDVMAKIGRPADLIGYDTIGNQERRRKGEPERFRFIRPRTILYAALIAVVGSIMLAALVTRSTVELNVLHDRNPLFVNLSDGRVRNGYTIKILNKRAEDAAFRLTVEGLPDAELKIVAATDIDPAALPVPGDRLASYRVFLSAAAPKDGAADIEFRVEDLADGASATNDSIFRGPE